jgi:hypothetical protein
VESWKGDHDDAMAVRDMEDVIAVCLQEKGFFLAWYKDTLELFATKKIKDAEATGEMLKNSLDQALAAFQGVCGLIAQAEQKEYSVNSSEAFKNAKKELKELRENLADRRLSFDRARIQQARKEIAEGRSKPAEDILRDLQSSGCGER